MFSFFSRRAYKSPVKKVPLEESEEKIEHDLDEVYKENLKIVAIAKPVGKWTKISIMN